MNPADIFRFLEAKKQFAQNHPKFGPFLRTAYDYGIKEGSVIEVSVTPPDGEPIVTNLKVQESDIAMLRELVALTGRRNP